MVKVVVVENRMSAIVFNKMMRDLSQAVEIRWMVFNKIFYQKSFRSSGEPFYFLHLPSESFDPDPIEKVSRSKIYFDININYKSYRDQIKKFFDEFTPDIVLGECTQFYELLVIEECLKRGILYLNPMATRYPPARFEFFLYDTDYPLRFSSAGGGSSMRSKEMVRMIAENSVKPAYIRVRDLTLKRLKAKISYGVKIIVTSLFVENVITPRPIRKLKSWMVTKYYFRKIEKNFKAIRKTKDVAPYFLYALQLQPENNIDIHGGANSNQAILISKLADILRDFNRNLVVKHNPIKKYQVNKSMYELNKDKKNLFFVSGSYPMSILQEEAEAVVTVTGTVLLESICKNIKVISLSKNRLSENSDVLILNDLDELRPRIAAFLEREINSSCKAESLIEDIYRTSFPGYIFDPIADHDFANDGTNDNDLAAAFKYVVDNLSAAQIDFDVVRPGRNISVQFGG